MRELVLAGIAIVTLIAMWLIRDEEEATASLPRHLNPTLCHAPWCMWTPQRPEECDCPQAAGA